MAAEPGSSGVAMQDCAGRDWLVARENRRWVAGCCWRWSGRPLQEGEEEVAAGRREMMAAGLQGGRSGRGQEEDDGRWFAGRKE